MFDVLGDLPDPRRLGDGELLGHVEELHRAEARLRAAQARALAELDAREVTVAACGRATRSWLVEELGLSRAEAGRRMLLARALPGLPATGTALDAGRVSAEHALVVVAGTRDLPAEQVAVVEPALADAAVGPGVTPADLAALVDGVREACGLNESRDERARRRLAERRVSLDVTFGGYGSLSGTLAPDVAETLRVALAAAAGPAGGVDGRSAAQRAHDGLGEIAAFFLAHGQTAAPEAGERPRVVVTVGWEQLRRELAGAGEQTVLAWDGLARAGLAWDGLAWDGLAGGGPLGPATARRLACDAGILPAVLGSAGEVLDLGRTTRTFSTAIRRAAALAQNHRCAFPRCRRPIRELHHIVHWAAGGATSLDNAAWLCAFHHWLAHEGGWGLSRAPDGTFAWTRPDGRRHTQAA